VGLGNAAMVALRVRAALRAEHGPDAALPLIRVIAQHAQLFAVMGAREPADPDARVRVFLGEEGERRDDLAYRGHPLPRGIVLNDVTAASAIEPLLALLPGAAPSRLSLPGPLGLPGGYPVRIEAGSVALDLPPGAALAEAVRFNERMGRGDGVEAVAEDGTVTFTAEAADAVRQVAPWLTAPLHPAETAERAARLAELLGRAA
jgi:hypothetical protein